MPCPEQHEEYQEKHDRRDHEPNRCRIRGAHRDALDGNTRRARPQRGRRRRGTVLERPSKPRDGERQGHCVGLVARMIQAGADDHEIIGIARGICAIRKCDGIAG